MRSPKAFFGPPVGLIYLWFMNDECRDEYPDALADQMLDEAGVGIVRLPGAVRAKGTGRPRH